MTIRKKTLGVIFSAIVLMGIMIYLVTYFILINGYVELETRDMIKSTDQVSKQMEDDLLKLESTALDWAPWDDTYQFIQDLNDSYIENNLSAATLVNLNLNFLIFIDPAGKIKYTIDVDLENETAIEADKEKYIRFLERYPVLVRNDMLIKTISGHIMIDDNIALIAASPILTSKFQGPVMGTLVVGNYLNSRAVESLEEKLKIPLEVTPIDPDQSVEALWIDETLLSHGNRFIIQRPDTNVIHSTLLLESLSEKPIFMLEMKKKRDIFLHGKHTLKYLLISFGVISLFFIAAMMIFLERTVLSRLSRLRTDVKQITLNGHGEERIAVTGKDEISSLSVDINQMLGKLWENEKQYRVLFESASDAILLLKEDEIVDCNLKALELFDRGKNQMIGKDMCSFSPERQPDGELSAQKCQEIIESVSGQDALLFEWACSKKDKTVFDTEMNLTRIDLPSGSRIQVIIRDLTQRRQTQRIMIQTEKMLSLGGLAAGMAHEINNPLAGMMQNAQVIENRLSRNLPANIKAAEEAGITLDSVNAYMGKRNILKLLKSIVHSGAQAARIVENMLQFARKSSSEKQSGNVVDLLENTIELAQSDYSLKSNYDFKNIKVVREYESSLLFISCHSSNLQQVFFNIIKNAAEAIFHSRVKNKLPELIFRIMKHDDVVQIEIEDNGPGIEEKICKRIFEPFFTTKGPKEGTGLGLSVSYFIVTEDHGGEISVESEVGKGTRFIIRLPLIAA